MKKLIKLVAFGYILSSVFVVDSIDARKRKNSTPPSAEVTDYSRNDSGSKKARKKTKKFNKAKKNKKKFVEKNSAEGYSDGEEEQFERKPSKNKARPKKLKNKKRRRNTENFDDNRNFEDRYSGNEKDQFDRRPNSKLQNRNYQQEDEYSENDNSSDEEQFKQRPINRKSVGKKLKKKNFGRKNKDKRKPRYDSQDLDSTSQNSEPKADFNERPLSKKQLKKMEKRKKALENKREKPSAEIEQENISNNSDDWKNEIAAKTSNTIEPVIDSKKINDSSIAVVLNEKMNKISAQSVLAQSEIASADKPSPTLQQESIKTVLAKLSNFHKSRNLIRAPKPVVQLYSGTKEYREDLNRYRTAFLEKAKV